MKLKSWAGPIALAVAIVAIVGGAVLLTRHGGSTPARTAGRPTVLHLSSFAAADAARPATAGARGAPDGSAPYQLTGTLPDGRPDDQPAWHPRHPSGSDATDVASALGLTGTPTRVPGGWVLREEPNRLVVRDGGDWSYGLDCAPDQPVSDEDVSVGCAYASSAGAGSAGTAAPPPPEPAPSTSAGPSVSPEPSASPGPSESAARASAAPILAMLGLSGAEIRVFAGAPTALVQASPQLGGVATSGWVTSLEIDASGHVVSADGWLSGADKGEPYPLISAPDAFEKLQAEPRPMIELCVVRKDGKPGCADQQPAQVTDAHLGLMLDYDGAAAVLVPAWLFDVKRQQEPVAEVAVDPAYLAPPPAPMPEPMPAQSVPEPMPAQSVPEPMPAQSVPAGAPPASTG